jgi:hypothetical protein
MPPRIWADADMPTEKATKVRWFVEAQVVGNFDNI